MIPWMMIASAWASPVTVEICGWYDTHFEDAYAGVGDDYLTDNSVDLPSFGARLKVTCTSCSPQVVVHHNPLPWNESDACADVTMDTAETYKVSLSSRAVIRGNQVNIWTDGDKDTAYAYVVTGVSPTGPATYDITTNVADQWNMAAAAGFAHRRRAGIVDGTGAVFDLMTEDCASGAAGCQSSDGIRIDTVTRDNKYVIAHEMGHQLWEEAAGVDELNNYDADPGDCYTNWPIGDFHEKNSMEYQAAAASEGWASFYAAIAFNEANATSSDCMYRAHNKTDWELEIPTRDATDNLYEVNCYFAPEPGESVFSYLDSRCLDTDPGHNRANAWDWTRALWMLSDEFTFIQITHIWANAGVNTWDSVGDDAWDCGTASCDDQPYARLRETVATHAAFDAGDLSFWDGVMAWYGVDR